MSTMPENRSAASVLVVDDEAGAREALRMILEPEFRVLTADSGERALEIVQSEDVDVVVLDLNLPNLNGWETFERLGSIRPEVEVVIITGHGSYAEAVKALHLHAFDFVTKPFDVNQVLQIVHRAAGSSQARRDSASRRTLHALTTELREAIDRLSQAAAAKLSDDERVEFERIRKLSQTLLALTMSSSVTK